MTNELLAMIVGAGVAAFPLLGCIIMLILEKEKWAKLAYKLEERQREVIRWLCEYCKGLGTFTREGNVIRFTKKSES